MAAKKRTLDDYDRWGTPKGITKTVSVTAENKKAAAAINAQFAAINAQFAAKKKPATKTKKKK